MLTAPLKGVSRRLPTPSAGQWFALRVMCWLRCAVAFLLVSPIGFASVPSLFGTPLNRGNYLIVAVLYLGFAVAALLSLSLVRGRYHTQLITQGTVDILALIVLAHLADSISFGLSMLIVMAVATLAVLSPPMLVGYFASLATLALLAEAILSLWSASETHLSSLVQNGLIGAVCFVTAYLINWLATRLNRQERLATQRGEDLRNQLAITQLVIAELQQGVMVVSDMGVLLTVNRAASVVLGGRALVGEALLRADRVGSPVPPDAADQLGLALREWQRMPTPRPESQEILLHLPGQRSDGLRLRVRFLRASAESGDTVMVVENLRNLEERAQQLKLASMGRLSASIAHEIRNPLAAIRHANSLLAEQFDDDSAAGLGGAGAASVQRLAGIIETNTVRINRIVEDVLSISRREPPAIEAIDLRRFLPAFVAEYCASVPEGSPPDRIDVHINSALPMMFDPNHLRQILVNVLSNASRYASRGPAAIVVEWRRRPDDRLELSVADDGPGLAPEVMQHLFEPFFTTEARGTGLGLYLARELCFANGASIRSERRPGDERYPAEFVIEPRRRHEASGVVRDGGQRGPFDVDLDGSARSTELALGDFDPWQPTGMPASALGSGSDPAGAGGSSSSSPSSSTSSSSPFPIP